MRLRDVQVHAGGNELNSWLWRCVRVCVCVCLRYVQVHAGRNELNCWLCVCERERGVLGVSDIFRSMQVGVS